MDMVNDGKDIRLDTPQAVKEALASGKDLYNPETGEFWWEYNYTGSIANTYVHLDDPNLLAVIDNPDFDLYEDIVGGLNYTGYITDSIETIIEDGEENAPLIDPRDEMFAQIASEDGWVIATPENVRKAVQSHMTENGADAPGKENGMDKAAEIAAWKEKHVPIDRNGDDALVMHKMADGSREFIVAHGYDEETGTGVTAPTTIPSPARRRTLRVAPSPPPVWRSSAPTSGTAMTLNLPLRKPVSK